LERFIPYSRYGELVEVVERTGIDPKEAASMLEEIHFLLTTGELKRGGKLSDVLNKLVEQTISREREELRELKAVREEVDALTALLSASGNVDVDTLAKLSDLLRRLAESLRSRSVNQVDESVKERIRNLIANALVPAVREKYVPAWMFAMLERNLHDARKLLQERELEVRRLRDALRARGISLPVARLYLVGGLLIEEHPIKGNGQTFTYRCEVCKENVNVQMPSDEDLKRAVDGDFLLRLHCTHCGSIKDFRPEQLASGYENLEQVALPDQWETNGPDGR
jgi:DNA replicative helicase MCM subunit Mcm2 (Cdc46/Mcm family)